MGTTDLSIIQFTPTREVFCEGQPVPHSSQCCPLIIHRSKKAETSQADMMQEGQAIVKLYIDVFRQIVVRVLIVNLFCITSWLQSYDISISQQSFQRAATYHHHCYHQNPHLETLNRYVFCESRPQAISVCIIQSTSKTVVWSPQQDFTKSFVKSNSWLTMSLHNTTAKEMEKGDWI